MTEHRGEGANFDHNWNSVPEARYLHWTRDEPVNQIQLAFRQHWLTFQELLPHRSEKKRVLEVGCGRGSLSAYFAEAGWDCTLLDISPAAIELARSAFHANSLAASFEVGDCLNMSFDDGVFDVVFSIGLLEHFDDIGLAIREQVRVLAPGGVFIGYVVPNMPENIQKDFFWVCEILRAILPTAASEAKTAVFRSDLLSPPYLAVMRDCGLEDVQASGIYPLPMISNSPDFPFTLLPAQAEAALVNHFNATLAAKQKRDGGNPWLCDEGYGQAFLVWGRKPEKY